MSLPLSEFCHKNNIVLVCLPPNATHFIQPLDVGFYKPFKAKWKSFVALYRLKNEGCNIQKHLIPKFINEIGLSYFSLDLKNAFRCCGLFPFNEDNLDSSKLVTATQVDPSAEEKIDELNPGEKEVISNEIIQLSFILSLIHISEPTRPY